MATSSAPATVPTPYVTTFPSPGVYTIPASTITITSETTVVAATTTPLASGGSYTVGGVTTVVETSTEIVVPVATTTSTPGGAVTSTLMTTTYTCPSAGTYTIAPLTTSVSTSTVWVYPVTSSYPAGTYTQSATTITVTETVSPYICPYETSAPPPPPPASTYKAAPPPASTYSAPAAPSPSSSSTPSVGNSGNHWAVTYTPYTTTGACKSVDAVNSDVADIAAKGFKALRIYSTDCSGLQNVGNAAAAHGLKMVIGVFIASGDLTDAHEQVQQISQWAKWSVVDLIVVGNESIQDKYVTASQLAGFISQAKSAFKSAGYAGPVTTTEPLESLQASAGALCDVIDIVGANLHPFFNSATDAANAGSFVASQLDIVDSLCPGKKGINLETGWPSAGNCNGMACPSPSYQATAIKGIIAAAGDRCVILSYANDEWKAAGPFDVEQHWGAIQLFT